MTPSTVCDRQGVRNQTMLFEVVDMKVCLLYTSDAADERSSVDLGGRRIIKKKKIVKNVSRQSS